jgi:hypothetical protein
VQLVKGSLKLSVASLALVTIIPVGLALRVWIMLVMLRGHSLLYDRFVMLLHGRSFLQGRSLLIIVEICARVVISCFVIVLLCEFVFDNVWCRCSCLNFIMYFLDVVLVCIAELVIFVVCVVILVEIPMVGIAKCSLDRILFEGQDIRDAVREGVNLKVHKLIGIKGVVGDK